MPSGEPQLLLNRCENSYVQCVRCGQSISGAGWCLYRICNILQIDVIFARETGVVDNGAAQCVRNKIGQHIHRYPFAYYAAGAQFLWTTFLRFSLVGG